MGRFERSILTKRVNSISSLRDDKGAASFLD